MTKDQEIEMLKEKLALVEAERDAARCVVADLIQLNELNLKLFEIDGMDTEYSVCSALIEFQKLLVDSCFEDVH